MNPERDLFVPAFWAKCREVIRPELDRAADRLRGAGQEATISTEEVDAAAPASPGPSLTLSAPDAALSFYGDVASQTVRAMALIDGRATEALVYALDQLDEGETGAIVAAWEAGQLAMEAGA